MAKKTPVPTGAPQSFFSSLKRMTQRVQTIIRNNPLLTGGILVLVLLAIGSNILLRADLTGGGIGGSSSSEHIKNLHACTSSGTVFEGLTPLEATAKFRADMSAVVQERQDLLIKPSLWSCASDTDEGLQPPMPALTAMATNKMPAWTVRTGANTYTTKPIRFADFSSIVMEYERSYECTLSEFQGKAPLIVTLNEDGDGTQTALESWMLLGVRANVFFKNMENERRRSRIAVERTISTLRSMEITSPLTTRMQCLVRQQLDLRSQMSLLADAMSCLPRIWDAATSLHDRSALPQSSSSLSSSSS